MSDPCDPAPPPTQLLVTLVGRTFSGEPFYRVKAEGAAAVWVVGAAGVAAHVFDLMAEREDGAPSGRQMWAPPVRPETGFRPTPPLDWKAWPSPASPPPAPQGLDAATSGMRAFYEKELSRARTPQSPAAHGMNAICEGADGFGV